MSKYAPKETSLQAAVQVDDGPSVFELISRNPSHNSRAVQEALVSACRFGKLQAANAIIEVV